MAYSELTHEQKLSHFRNMAILASKDNSIASDETPYSKFSRSAWN